MEVTAKDLRSRVGEVLKTLDRGEAVTVTYRGKPRAKLVRIDEEGGGASRGAGNFPAFGMWRDRDDMTDVGAYVRGLRETRTHAR